MAFQILSLFDPTVLTNTVAAIYSAPASTTLYRGRARFTNTDTVTRTVTSYYVPTGRNADPTTIFMNAEGIAPNTHIDIDLPMMSGGAVFYAFASVGAVIIVTAIDGVLSS